jgi:integrase
VNEPLLRVALTALQAASAILQNQETVKVVAPLGCPRWGEAVALTENDIYDDRVHITKSIHGQVKSRAEMRSVPHVSEFKPFPKTPKALRQELAEHGAHILSLRHTYAYLLKTSGVHVTTAQKLMVHANPEVTLGIYARFRDEEIDHTGTAIMDSLRGKSDYLLF